MPVTFLFVDDLGDREERLREACALAELPDGRNAGVEMTMVRSVFDLADLEGAGLARFDAIFVDFGLSTALVGGDQDLRCPQIVRDGLNAIDVETGVGVLLWLTQQSQDPDYLKARRENNSGFPQRRDYPHLLTLGHLANTWTKLYAAAGRSWFGTRHVDATDAHALSQVFGQIAKEILDGHDQLDVNDRRNRLVALAAVPFEQMMQQRCAEGADWFVPSVSAEAYDWYGMYLQALGKVGGLPGIRRVVDHRWGVECTWGSLNNQYAKQAATPLQRRLLAFMNAFAGDGEGEAWDHPWSASQHDPELKDPMLDVLTDSHLFWTSKDVRAALVDYRLRGNPPLPIPPEPLRDFARRR